MKTHRVRQNMALINMTLGDPLLRICEVCCWENISADGKHVHSRLRILTDSARKRNRKEVLTNYNKTRNNIGHQHDRWVELMEALRVDLMRNCKHQCHCACTSEIGACIINYAERQAAHKTTSKM